MTRPTVLVAVIVAALVAFFWVTDRWLRRMQRRADARLEARRRELDVMFAESPSVVVARWERQRRERRRAALRPLVRARWSRSL